MNRFSFIIRSWKEIRVLTSNLPAACQPYIIPNDDSFQAGELYRWVMTDEDREHLIGKTCCNAPPHATKYVMPRIVDLPG